MNDTELADAYVRRSDGLLTPVAVPAWLARRVAIYKELVKLGLDQPEIRFLLGANLDDAKGS